jgi:hypothetical protein
VELKSLEQGTIYIAVRYVPEPGLGEFQLGPEGALVYDPEVLEVIKVKGVGPYQVESYNLATPGLVRFVASLKPGREAINEGPVVELLIKPVEGVEPGTETELVIEDETGVEMVDAFKDAAGKELVPDIVPGRVKIKLLKGDVDGDSVVTASDARFVARAILGLETLTAEQREAADVAPPFGAIDVTDVRYIAQAAAGLRTLDPAFAEGGLLTIAQLADWLITTPNPSKPEVTRLTLSQSLGAYTLRVEGQNIAGGRLRVYSLTGLKVIEREFTGNLLQFSATSDSGRPLANGVYLYVVQVWGRSGEVWQSEIGKLVILR